MCVFVLVVSVRQCIFYGSIRVASVSLCLALFVQGSVCETCPVDTDDVAQIPTRIDARCSLNLCAERNNHIIYRLLCT